MTHVHPRAPRLPLLLAVAAGLIGCLARGEAALALITPTGPTGTVLSNATPSNNYVGDVAGTVSDGDDCASVATATTTSGTTPAPSATVGTSVGATSALGTCSSHVVEVVDAGTVEIQIEWTNGLSDLDLYVYECASPIERDLLGQPTNPQEGCGTLVASSAEVQDDPADTALEQVTLLAQANTAYQILAVPFFAFVTELYSGCIAYTGAGGCPGGPGGEEPPPPPPPNGDPAANFATGCSSGATSARVRGGGMLAMVDGVLQGKFSLRADVRSGTDVAGKLTYYAEDAQDLRFSGDRITCSGSASYLVDGPGFEFRGRGDLVQRVDGRSTTRQVCFKSVARGGDLPLFGLTIYELASDRTCDTSRVVYQKAPALL